MIKVSIIVPVYNVYPYLDKCLHSLVHQTLKEIEIIVVNDGSKDNSQDIIDRYAKKDKRIISLKKKNGGLSDARNYGIFYAKGEYLAFLDSDDYVDLDLYEKMYEMAHQQQADMVEADFIWEYPTYEKKDISKVQDRKRIMMDIRVVAWNKLYKRSLIEKLGIQFSKGLRYEDIDWCYKILPFVKNFASVHDTYIHYVQRESSIANTQNEKVRDVYQILKNAILYYQEKNLYQQYKDQLEYTVMRIIFGSSFKRVVQIKDKSLRRKILDEGYDFLEENFPQWKKNPYLKTESGLKNKYYRTINRVTYRIYEHLFRMKERIK